MPERLARHQSSLQAALLGALASASYQGRLQAPQSAHPVNAADAEEQDAAGSAVIPEYVKLGTTHGEMGPFGESHFGDPGKPGKFKWGSPLGDNPLPRSAFPNRQRLGIPQSSLEGPRRESPAASVQALRQILRPSEGARIEGSAPPGVQATHSPEPLASGV